MKSCGWCSGLGLNPGPSPSLTQGGGGVLHSSPPSALWHPVQATVLGAMTGDGVRPVRCRALHRALGRGGQDPWGLFALEWFLKTRPLALGHRRCPGLRDWHPQKCMTQGSLSTRSLSMDSRDMEMTETGPCFQGAPGGLEGTDSKTEQPVSLGRPCCGVNKQTLGLLAGPRERLYGEHPPQRPQLGLLVRAPRAPRAGWRLQECTPTGVSSHAGGVPSLSAALEKDGLTLWSAPPPRPSESQFCTGRLVSSPSQTTQNRLSKMGRHPPSPLPVMW